MSAREPEEARLLPWTGPEGRPCYVIGDGSGPVSRAADRIERIRLGMAGELVGHAGEILADQRVTHGELHYLASRLMESLRDVGRIAEARGAVARAAQGAAGPGGGVPAGGGFGGGASGGDAASAGPPWAVPPGIESPRSAPRKNPPPVT
ncbi:hypothetical protein [Streptomyces genisteinicus]|uniref:hypothetical protein n=1 Tax=Streptomyces genisteinicus TaxID=2768068 RepID=UPI001FECF0D3|nr:hypothetical protein [Streptomyces genisteinicus]